MIELTINGENKNLEAAISLGELLDGLSVNRRQVAVEINQELVPRETHSDRILADGDQVEIVTLVGGG